MDTETEQMITQNLSLAREVLQAVVAHPDAFPDNLLVIPMDLLSRGKGILTPARYEVLLAIRERGSFERLQDLADLLGRTKHRVSKDVNALTALGLIHKERHGRTTTITADQRPILLT